MKNTAKILILAVALALAALPAWAQQQRMQGQPPEDGPRRDRRFAPDQGPDAPPSEERREEIRKKIEMIRIWRMTEELKLDAAMSAKLAALLGPVEQKRRETQREQMETMRSLRQVLRADRPDQAKIKTLLDRLENNHRAVQELRNSEFKGIKEILTPEQQARFLVFQMDFEREIREMIAGARGGGPGRPGLGMGRGPQRGDPERFPDR